ncbi:MAG: hypothetical protein EBS53_07665 [Bacteroidetes bacterium]|nr:hypothetical protein [Bacteroidota bacterium]
MKKTVIRLLSVAAISSNSLFAQFAQLDGDYTPDLADVSIPIFDGVNLFDDVSAISFDLNLVQSLVSPKITSTDSTISALDFDVFGDETLIIGFDADVAFSSTATLAGSLVRLVGAKVTILRGATGTGTLDQGEGPIDVTVTGVTGSFSFRTLTVDLEAGEIQGIIAPGALRISAYQDENPSQNGTVTARYTQEDFGPYEFPADNIQSPECVLSLTTTPKGTVSGSAEFTVGDFDPITLDVKGRWNAKTGVSTLTLSKKTVKGVTATLNLDENGDLFGTKNSLSVLGYKLKF